LSGDGSPDCGNKTDFHEVGRLTSIANV
jgi:hypothetical protein